MFAYLVFVQNVVRGFMAPFVVDYLHRHIKSNVRATVISTKSSMANLVSIFGLAIFGFMTAHVNLLHSMMILGIATLILGAISYRSYQNKIS